VPLGGQLVPRRGDPCVCLGGNRKERGSIVGVVARKRRSVDAHQRADFLDDRVEDLSGRRASGDECGDAPKRGLLGLDLREMLRRRCGLR
jgi:hypothetical protein